MTPLSKAKARIKTHSAVSTVTREKCPFCLEEYPSTSIKYHFCKVGRNYWGFSEYVSNYDYFNELEMNKMKKQVSEIHASLFPSSK